MTTKSAPVALKIVAILFVLSGILAAIEVVVLLLRGNVFLNFGVLGLFIGPGLLRFSRGWRTCALVFLSISLIGIPVFTLFLLGSPELPDARLFGIDIGHAPKPFAFLMAAVMFLVVLWQFRVLVRPDIRRLFVDPTGLRAVPERASPE